MTFVTFFDFYEFFLSFWSYLSSHPGIEVLGLLGASLLGGPRTHIPGQNLRKLQKLKKVIKVKKVIKEKSKKSERLVAGLVGGPRHLVYGS